MYLPEVTQTISVGFFERANYLASSLSKVLVVNMAFHRSLVFQVMPTFISRLLNKSLFSEEDLNKALKGVLTNELSFRKASKVLVLSTVIRKKCIQETLKLRKCLRLQLK